MKKNLLISICLLICASIFSAPNPGHDGSWYGPYQIKEIQPARDHGTDEGGYPIYIKWDMINNNDSRIPLNHARAPFRMYWVIRSDIDDGKRLFNIVMIAFALGKKVYFKEWSSILINGHPYPRVGAVKVVD